MHGATVKKNEVDCFCALWNETLLLSFKVYYAAKTVHILL